MVVLSFNGMFIYDVYVYIGYYVYMYYRWALWAKTGKGPKNWPGRGRSGQNMKKKF